MKQNKFNRREFLRVAALGTGAAALAGCAVPVAQVVEKTVVVEKVVTPTTAPAAAPSAVQADLKIWVWHNNEDQIEITKPLFNARFPDIKVTPEVLEFGDLHNKLFTSLAAGAGAPDIAWVELSQQGKFAYYGPEAGLTDMLPLMDRDGVSREGFLEWAFNNGLDKTKTALCVMPRAVCPAVTFYRRDVFETAGLPSAPEEVGGLLKDWSTWFETGKQLADPENERFFMINAESHGPVFSTLGGANYFTEEGELRIGNDPALEELLEWHVKARQEGIDTVEIRDEWGPEGQTALRDGMIATNLAGAWWSMFVANFASASAGKWGMVNVPEVKGANGGGDTMVIPKQGAQVDAAWEYVKFAATDVECHRQWLTFGGVGSTCAWKAVYDLPEWNRADNFFGGQQTLKLARDILLQMPGLVLNPNDPIASAALSKYVGECVREGGNPAEYLKKARDEALAQIE